MRKIPIRFGNLAAVFRLLGSLYRSPADAIKEHVSNAIDEHLKAENAGRARPVCRVIFTIERSKVTIEYPYGMSKKEFQEVIQRVADSAKKNFDFKQIGQLGIGMFSFFQFSRRCVFFSRKENETDTIKVTVREGSDKAEFETATKKESLKEPGIKIVISGLLFDPTKARGPLSPARLQKVFAEKFDTYLRDGSLEIVIRRGGTSHTVKPLKIELPRICQDYKEQYIKGDSSKKIILELYFDPSGRGKVGIRHAGVTVVDDISTLSAYGLEESVYASGEVRGFIDADFLKPLPARTGFEENNDWMLFIEELDRLRPSIEVEVDALREKAEEKKLTEIQRKAIELARDIFNSDDFADLELLEGLGRRTPTPILPPNGFDFVPASIRIEPGEIGNLFLRVFVPQTVPDNRAVRFSVSEPSISLKPKRTFLKESEADNNGVVSIRVSVVGKVNTSEPVILTATSGSLRAEARIRIAEKEQTRKPIIGREKEGRGINYEETAFEDGPSRHSRYVSKIVQINTLNPDYQAISAGSEEEMIAYAALMIGKETIAFNDKSGAVDDFLERLITFYFRLRRRLGKMR